MNQYEEAATRIATGKATPNEIRRELGPAPIVDETADALHVKKEALPLDPIERADAAIELLRLERLFRLAVSVNVPVTITQTNSESIGDDLHQTVTLTVSTRCKREDDLSHNHC